MTVAVIVTAAGSGNRLGYGIPKALVALAGESILSRAVRGAFACPRVAAVIVTAAPENLAEFRAALPQPPEGKTLAVVAGGQTRQRSVANGLEALPADTRIVLIHDAARCLTPPAVFDAVIDAVEAGKNAVVPAIAVTDTIKVVGPAHPIAGGGEAYPVEQTLNRPQLRAVQTPQGFTREIIELGHGRGAVLSHDEAVAAPDDAALVEAMGLPTWTVPGSARSRKITEPEDLRLAELELEP